MSWFEKQDIEVTIPEHAIQQKVAEIFPFTRSYLLAFDANFSDPTISLSEKDNRMIVRVNVTSQTLSNNTTQHGTLSFSGKIAYDPKQKAFFLRPLHLDDVAVEGFSEHYTKQVHLIAERILEQNVSPHPVYVLEDNNPQQKISELTLRDASVKEHQLVLTFSPSKNL